MEWGWPQWYVAFFMALIFLKLMGQASDLSIDNSPKLAAWLLVAAVNFMVIVALHKGGFW